MDHLLHKSMTISRNNEIWFTEICCQKKMNQDLNQIWGFHCSVVKKSDIISKRTDLLNIRYTKYNRASVSVILLLYNSFVNKL